MGLGGVNITFNLNAANKCIMNIPQLTATKRGQQTTTVLPCVYGRDNFLSLFHLQRYFIMDVLHENCVPNYLRSLHLK